MKAGDKVDDFTAVDQNNQSVSLSSLLVEGPVVLYFYPKAMSPG